MREIISEGGFIYLERKALCVKEIWFAESTAPS